MVPNLSFTFNLTNQTLKFYVVNALIVTRKSSEKLHLQIIIWKVNFCLFDNTDLTSIPSTAKASFKVATEMKGSKGLEMTKDNGNHLFVST